MKHHEEGAFATQVIDKEDEEAIDDKRLIYVANDVNEEGSLQREE